MPDLSNKNILIVGASGFLGRHLSRTLIEQKAHVIGLSRSTPINKLGFDDYLAVDLEQPNKLKTVLQKHSFDFVVNCSAAVSNILTFEAERGLLNSHLLGLQNLIEVLSEYPTQPVFIHTGSAREYGSRQTPVEEKSMPQPDTPYGYVKFAASEYIKMRSIIHRFPLAICRPFLIYGGDTQIGLIAYCINQIKKKEKILLQNPEFKLDLIHIDDVVSGLIASMDLAQVGGTICNLGTGIGTTVLEVANHVCQKLQAGEIKITGSPTDCGMLVAAKERKLLATGWHPSKNVEMNLTSSIKLE